MHRCRFTRSTVQLACAALLVIPCVATPAFANRDSAASGHTTGAPLSTVESPQSPPAVPAQASLEDAVASVVVVALTDQFDGKPISVNIDSYDVQVSGARERVVSGQGRVGVQGSGASITFNYRTVYDVLSSNAGYPAITISRFGTREHSVPNDAMLIGELDERIASTLSKELGGKRVWLQFNSIQSFESDERYVRIRADGIADFGPDGSTPTRVEALYDRGQHTWLQVNYELGVAPASTSLASTGG